MEAVASVGSFFLISAVIFSFCVVFGVCFSMSESGLFGGVASRRS